MPSWLFARPPFQHFSVLETLLSPKITFFYRNFKLQCLQFKQIVQFQSLKLGKISVLKATFHYAFSSQRSQIWQYGLFTRPSIQPFGMNTYTKSKNECPPGAPNWRYPTWNTQGPHSWDNSFWGKSYKIHTLIQSIQLHVSPRINIIWIKRRFSQWKQKIEETNQANNVEKWYYNPSCYGRVAKN